jgi:hypothetical protein
MKKQKVENNTGQRIAEAAGVLGAWVLIATALMVCTEKIMHASHASHEAAKGHDSHVAAYKEPEAIRAEGARETARLPEEYDVGLRMPAVSGF